MKLVLACLVLLAFAPALSACVHSAIYSSRAETAHPPGGIFLELNGAKTHVVRRGETGPPVLMIHGASANAEEFTGSLAPHLEDDFRVLMPDRPGHGYSARLANSHELQVQAAQMAAVLEALAPGERAVVVGHSFGGGVALRLALDRPDLVAGLVLVAPVSHDWGGGGVAWHTRAAAAPVFGPVFSQLVPIVGPGQADAGVAGVFDPAAAPENYAREAGLPLLFRPSHFRANARDVAHLREELRLQQSRYGELGMPVTVWSGLRDTVIKPDLHVGRLTVVLPRLDLIELPEAGHMPHHTHSEEITSSVRRLASVAPAG